MSSYEINIAGDTLKLKFGSPATGEEIVKDAAMRLEEMVASGELPGGPLLKIDGPCTVAAAYVIGHRVSHLYGAIAIFDPKVGKNGTKAFIVAISHNPSYRVGEIIETEEPLKKRKSQLKVILCGPPHSGKSCLREGLKEAIKRIEGAPYPYMITACPDGEGAWYSEAARRDPALAKKLKDEYKAKFTPEFAEKAAGWVNAASTPLNIIDVGGKITAENRQIMKPGTHAVILSGDSSKTAEWEKLCEELGLKVIANIRSEYDASEDAIASLSPVLTGLVHRLERGEDVSRRPMVEALAKILVGLVG
ncbi:MAG: CRISPR-associated protein Csx3 [Cyanobacteriota bacterium]|nr:CRISPR-associated protein Csx3 [Cyanobacteriota bacterium]